MINKDQAINIASTYVKKIPVSEHTLVLQLEETIEFELGWVFFYQTKAFLESGNFRDSVIGNAPIIVDKRDGKIVGLGTAHSTETYIAMYLKREKEK
jgi:hypothetical protein